MQHIVAKKATTLLLRMRFHATALIYFDAVRRFRSVREAARTLHVAPSAVSRQLQTLEAKLDAPLFDVSLVACISPLRAKCWRAM